MGRGAERTEATCAESAPLTDLVRLLMEDRRQRDEELAEEWRRRELEVSRHEKENGPKSDTARTDGPGKTTEGVASASRRAILRPTARRRTSNQTT